MKNVRQIASVYFEKEVAEFLDEITETLFIKRSTFVNEIVKKYGKVYLDEFLKKTRE